MSRTDRDGFVARPSDAESWGRRSERRSTVADAFTARLTIDVTPVLRGRIRMAAFRQGLTMAELLRDLLAREFPPDEGATP
ncbi:hypothetical protein [Niveispirillum sp. KHB5.9]|uniref:hypothetical protein n=1 Tax=Niveispirillum sp. KHB5.9 TaxID=3400269 RepID=UPI003A8B508F